MIFWEFLFVCESWLNWIYGMREKEIKAKLLSIWHRDSERERYEIL